MNQKTVPLLSQYSEEEVTDRQVFVWKNKNSKSSQFESPYSSIMESCCSCKCGVESPDVQMSKSRLIFTFITINLIAAALGLNRLAISNSGDTTLGRTSLVHSRTVTNVPFGDEVIEEATLIQEYEFAESGVCTDIGSSLTLDISKADCQDIRNASVGWTGLGIISILILFVLLLLLLRIECRKLCSKRMSYVLYPCTLHNI